MKYFKTDFYYGTTHLEEVPPATIEVSKEEYEAYLKEKAESFTLNTEKNNAE